MLSFGRLAQSFWGNSRLRCFVANFIANRFTRFLCYFFWAKSALVLIFTLLECLTYWRTDWLTSVGARDTCVSKKDIQFVTVSVLNDYKHEPTQRLVRFTWRRKRAVVWLWGKRKRLSMGGKRRPHLSSFPDNIEINVCHQTTGFRGRPFSNVEPYIWALLHWAVGTLLYDISGTIFLCFEF